MNIIPIKYIDPNVPRLEDITENSDWVDTYVSRVFKNGVEVQPEDGYFNYERGDLIFVKLGFALKLPKSNEADIRERSSTFRRTGLLLTNGAGVIDEPYCGNNDEWSGEFFALRDGSIEKYQRLLQFKVVEKQKPAKFLEVEYLSDSSRGGYGSTGK